MKSVNRELQVRRSRRRELKTLILSANDLLLSIQLNNRMIHSYISPQQEGVLGSVLKHVRLVESKSTLLQLKLSVYQFCVNVILDAIHEIKQYISKHGAQLHTLKNVLKIDIEDTNSVLGLHFHVFRCVPGESSEPELDPEFNESAKRREQFMRKMYPTVNGNLQEQLNGAKLYVPRGDGYMILYGILDNDFFQLSAKALPTYALPNPNDCDRQFAEQYICCIQLRDFMVHSVDEICVKIKNAHRDMLALEKKSFAEVQKMFQTGSAVRQRRLLQLLLLSNNGVKFVIPLLESINHSSDRSEICNSLGNLKRSLATCADELKAEIQSYATSDDQISQQHKILALNVDKHIKSKAMDKLKESNSGRESGTKAQQYIDGLLKIPFGVYHQDSTFSDNTQRASYVQRSQEILDNCVYGHKEAKTHIKRLVAQWTNGPSSGSVFGFQGPPGTGKTTLAKNGLAKCLMDDKGSHRPIAFLPLGGTSSGSLLEGHGYTYMGSTWGRIVDTLMEKQCMNPIIYIDELDKVSASERGQEIIGILTHLTDPTQNHEFNDRYFAGIKFDLSRAIFIFSYNDSSKIDRILRDRITEIRTTYLSKSDKLEVVYQFILPEIFEAVGINVHIPRDVIEHIIDTYTYEAGVRKLKERLYDVVRDVNLENICSGETYAVTVEVIDNLFCKLPRALYPKASTEARVGIVNGLYANTIGLGGITRIEVHQTVGEKLDLQLTGSQGKVMQESMRCAKTLAWSLLSSAAQDAVNKNTAIHIHCPEAATAKDGPSAGTAITTAILSRFTGLRIRGDVAMTGEVDLNGNVHPVGGIDAKLGGALRSGIKTVLLPKDNVYEMKQYCAQFPEHKHLNLVLISHISETFEHTLLGEIEGKVTQHKILENS